MRADNARAQADQSVLPHNAARRAGRAALYLAAALIALTSAAAVFWWRYGNPSPSDRDPLPNGTSANTDDGSASIVRNHGGQIDLASSPGQGTTATVLWPAAPGMQEAYA